MCGSNTSPAVSPGAEKPGGTRAANFASPTLNAGEADTAEVVDAFELAAEVPAGRGDVDEFGRTPISIFAPVGKACSCVERDDVAVDTRLARSTSAFTMFMPGEPMK